MRLYLADGRQAEHLEPAAIGQDRPLPINEPVQPARGADDIEPGADVEVIGIAEDDLSAHLAQLARVNRLNASLRADGHKDRRIHDSMRGRQSAQARPGTCIGLEQLKHGCEGSLPAAMVQLDSSWLRTFKR